MLKERLHKSIPTRILKHGISISFQQKRKPVVIVNAEASIAYDLSKIETEIDEETKTVTITNIPEPELNINPSIEYYDVQQDYLNQFGAEDYNKIKNQVEDSLRKTIEQSSLATNAENRLISELQKIYILTHSMGWTLYYDGTVITNEAGVKNIKQ